MLIRELRSLPDSDNLSIAFPDEGAHKRFHSGLQQWPSITCIKVREGDKRVVNIKDGEMRGRKEGRREREGEGRLVDRERRGEGGKESGGGGGR